MLVKVLQRHIERGERGHGAECPIALALKSVGFTNLTVLSTKWWCREFVGQAPFSKNVTKFVRAFDAGKPVHPFTFRTRKPKEKTK